MAQHGNNPAVTQYMSLTFPSPYTQEAARVWINMNRTPPFLNWGICEASAPEIIIGGLGLKPGSDVQAHTAEFGFWVGEAFWGKGYGSEALEGLTEWCFTGDFRMGEKEVKRLWAVVFEGNKGSMRCFEKCGYFPEGVMKGAVEKWGKVLDLYIFGLTKTDWEARRARTAES
ncbi:hypothetical protein N0V94_008877 [Neodidymelliopsis sp. IMI 364377]|nr:hypothetical protein N0V94_008877 [Neodidymelliopsis sp. IMI 364377]